MRFTRNYLIRLITFLVCAEINVTTQNIDSDYLLQTSGCKIPNYMKTNYITDESAISWAENATRCANPRIVFIDRVSFSIVKFRIDHEAMRKFAFHNISCGYRTTRTFLGGGFINKCELPIADGHHIHLPHDVWILVTCTSGGEYRYADWYPMLKKIEQKRKKKINIKNRTPWNVLMLGMDSMSRGRLFHYMPKLYNYFKEQKWLDYRAHQKVGENTWPNLLSVMSGVSHEWLQENSRNCILNRFLWSKYKKSGYITSNAGDSYYFTCDQYQDKMRIDHVFQILEADTYGKSKCFGNKQPIEHLYDYALQFVKSYKRQNFFGFFFSSFSHIAPLHLSHKVVDPSPLQDTLLNFFDELKVEGTLKNTFIFFFGDHGLTRGPATYSNHSKEVYYDTRMPMLYIWVPYEFRKRHLGKYNNMITNQFRYTTHYDTYITLVEILNQTHDKVNSGLSLACPNCTGLMREISTKRNCLDANIHNLWCVCNMKDAKDDPRSLTSALIIMVIINKELYALRHKCHHPLKFNKLIKSLMLRNGNLTSFAVSAQLTPGDIVFEASVTWSGTKFINISELMDLNPKPKCEVENEILFCYCI